MAVKHKFIWFGRGFLAAAAALFALHASEALAQVRRDISITSPAAPIDQRPRRIIRGGQDLPQAPALRRLRRPAGPLRGSDTVRREFASDRASAVQAAPRVPQDGDLTPPQLVPVQDGIVNVGAPVSIKDGDDPTRVDGRAAADIAAFASPPAGYDPGAFNIELSPAQDRRPGRFFRFEPYQPVGIRVGSFVLFPEIEFAAGATNNIFASSDRRADRTGEIAPRLRLVSNWRVHALEFNASGRRSYHAKFSTEDARDYSLEARARLDITRRTNIEALLSQNVTQETRGTANVASVIGQDRMDIVTRVSALTGNHRFNRLSLQLRGAVEQVNYAPNDVNIATAPAAPVIVRVDDRDYTSREIGLRAAWEFKPTLIAFVDGQIRDSIYTQLQGGNNRDSTDKLWRAGLSFGNDGAYLRGEISVGYGRRQPDQVNLSPVEAFLFDANLAWRVNALTSLLFTASTDFSETSIAGASAGLTRTMGISVRHAFRRNLIAEAGINRSHVNYKGAGITETSTTGNLGLEYLLNRNVGLRADYSHVAFRANQPGNGYETDTVRIGLRLRK